MRMSLRRSAGRLANLLAALLALTALAPAPALAQNADIGELPIAMDLADPGQARVALEARIADIEAREDTIDSTAPPAVMSIGGRHGMPTARHATVRPAIPAKISKKHRRPLRCAGGAGGTSSHDLYGNCPARGKTVSVMTAAGGVGTERPRPARD